jgi:hypothetical protein
MTEPNQTEGKKSGPYLAAAFFCETAIVDREDGALSAIRMIDRLVFALDPAAPPDFPSETHRINVNVKGILGLKTGDSPGSHRIQLVMESPSGQRSTPYDQDITLPDPPQGGMNVRLDVTVAVKGGGLFWFHVLVDGEEFTRMPLQIQILRDGPESPPASPATEPPAE